MDDRDATPGTQPCPRRVTAPRSCRPGTPTAHRWIEVKRGDGAVVAVGVAERSRRSEDPIETIELSFKRTVYSANDVAGLHEDGAPVLTILFRHDRFVVPPWSLPELRANRVVKSWPQSIVRLRDKEGIAWVEAKLEESH